MINGERLPRWQKHWDGSPGMTVAAARGRDQATSPHANLGPVSHLACLVWTSQVGFFSGVKGALTLCLHWRTWNWPQQKRCSVGYYHTKLLPAGWKQFFGRFGPIPGHQAASYNRIKRDKHRSTLEEKDTKKYFIAICSDKTKMLNLIAHFPRASSIFVFIFSTRKAPHETGTMLIVKHPCPSVAPSCSHFSNGLWGQPGLGPLVWKKTP